ncbi:MAG TPA: penicillin-binding transpeptidase domain-containing protein [Anaerolineaceae bacterium]|nr:penicillin-binding transpeptidase domain-containing protein [Anaerolineaceae bacterium]
MSFSGIKRILPLCLLAVILLAACGPQFGLGAAPYPSATPFQFNSSGVRDPAALEQTVSGFLAAWQKHDYAGMYALTTAVTRDAIPLDEYQRRYQAAERELTLASLDGEVLGMLASQASAQVNLRVTYHTSILGDLQSQILMKLVMENDAWRIQWEDGLIHDQLKGGNHFFLDVIPPSRGNIYDRNGHALAAFTDAVALGVVPGKIDPQSEQTLVSELAGLTGKTPEQVRAAYAGVDPSWYVPIGEVSAGAVQPDLELLKSLEPGLQMNTFRSRYYEDGAAAHAVGYVQPIPAEKADEYRANGYLPDEMVGAAGLEEWGEAYLRGRPKAALYVVNPQGETITRLAQMDAQPAESMVTTLDKELQLKIQRSMGNYRGAVVVMELNSGRILAIASNPTFDPNWFQPANRNSAELEQIYSNPDSPLYNRATQGQYPLGSVFKIVTMASGLESKLFKPSSEYICGHVFTELDYPLYDWTYTFGVAPSGLLDLPGGLIRSCNPWFWHIGLTLYRDPQHQFDVTKMARAFGLGSPTGLDQVAEASGSIPDPANENKAVQDAIGQGDVLVTPLQVVDFIAAVANGGTLYRPQLVEKVTRLDGSAAYTFKPEIRGRLPVSPENLKVIQDALYGVVHSEKPQGTAHFVLANLDIPVSGKTGTAQTATDPHGWFAGYTAANQPGKSDIAVVVILENAGEGSLVAAPLFRRVVQLYFSDNQDPGALMPWETTFYSVAAPEPNVTPSAVPTLVGTPVPAGVPTSTTTP